MEEELKEILANTELDEAGKTQAIQNLVGKNFVPLSRLNDKSKEIAAQKESYKALQDEYEAFKQSKMTDEEKQAEAIKLQEEKYSKQNALLSKMYAENTFSKAGFKEEEYKDILNSIVSNDVEKTQALASAICNTMLTQKKEIEKKIENSIVNNNIKPPAGEAGNQAEITKSNIQKLLDEATQKGDYTNMAYYSRIIQEIK